MDGLGRAIAAAYNLERDSLPHSGVAAELKPSGASRGRVGVFALSEIKKGDRPFRGENEEIVWFEKRLIAHRRMPIRVRQLYKDFCLERDGRLGCPVSFNRLTAAWYLQSAKSGFKANLRPDQYYEFYALRNIRPGEELIARLRSVRLEGKGCAPRQRLGHPLNFYEDLALSIFMKNAAGNRSGND